MSRVDGKTVVVTGGGRGIGRAIARAAAAAGANVVVNDLGVALDGSAPSNGPAASVVREIEAAGGSAVASGESVTSMEGARRIVDAGVSAFGTVDGVVCCAGVLRPALFAEMTEDDFDLVVATHLKGHFTMFRALVDQLGVSGRPGSLVAISSGYLFGDPARANYRAAKAGVVALMKSVALAGMDGAWRCNCIAPMAGTRMTDAAGIEIDGAPEDIAALAVYLLSDQAIDVNGQIFSAVGSHLATWRDPAEDRMVPNSRDQNELHERITWLRQANAPRVRGRA
jgi:NAD(P)-dependent dehydrogenase (short-subunit alcohol dehydrogenase family)